jgi:glutathione gamma-glutamylcysteinyltransferase
MMTPLGRSTSATSKLISCAVKLKQTFHRRELKAPAVAFSDPRSRPYFIDAIKSGYGEGYFPLAEQFQSQSHYAYCGISSLSMALNSLLIDPQRIWQGSWRWFDDSMLTSCEGCGPSAEVVQKKGISMKELACVGRCNGADVTENASLTFTYEQFMTDLRECTSRSAESNDSRKRPILIASYARPKLNQTGDGHFSPLAAYSPESDMVLIMDVARFKYPPHWVPSRTIYEAMQTSDKDGIPRGYILVRASDKMVHDFELSCECCEIVGGVPVVKVCTEGESINNNDDEAGEHTTQNHNCTKDHVHTKDCSHSHSQSENK